MIRKMRYRATLIATIVLSWTGAAIANEARVVNVYNWPDYIAESVLEEFEAQTGIMVNYDVFDSQEALESRLLDGGSGYDVVVTSGDFLKQYVHEGVFLKLDKSKLPNLIHMDPLIAHNAKRHDPDNNYSVNYMWGTAGLGMNLNQATKVLKRPVKEASWTLLFNPDNASKLARCGIGVLNAPDELIPAALSYLKLDPHTENPQDLALAEATLQAIEPYINYYEGTDYVDDLANGDLCLAMGWSSSILQAAYYAQEERRGIEISYMLPHEGALIWLDQLAIPIDAPHPMNAHLFINFLQDPQIAAANTNYVAYPNGNLSSQDYIDFDILNNRTIYPEEEIMERLFPSRRLTAYYQEDAQGQQWAKIQ